MSRRASDSKDSGASLGRVLVTGSEIAARVWSMGAEIRRDYAGQTLHFVALLDGGTMFASDLARAIGPDVDLRMHFIRASSYGEATVSDGSVQVEGAETLPLAGARVLLVDDIVDTGRTAREVFERLRQRGAASIRFAAFLSKRHRRVVDVPVDYLGFELPGKFVVGYGMDYAGRFRGLPDVRALDEPRRPAGDS